MLRASPSAVRMLALNNNCSAAFPPVVGDARRSGSKCYKSLIQPQVAGLKSAQHLVERSGERNCNKNLIYPADAECLFPLLFPFLPSSSFPSSSLLKSSPASLLIVTRYSHFFAAVPPPPPSLTGRPSGNAESPEYLTVLSLLMQIREIQCFCSDEWQLDIDTTGI